MVFGSKVLGIERGESVAEFTMKYTSGGGLVNWNLIGGN